MVEAEVLALGPGLAHPRHDADRAPVTGLLEVAGEGRALAGGEVQVPLLVLDPQAGQEGGVRHPAAGARHGGLQPAAARREPGRLERRVALLEGRVDLGCHRRVVDRHAAVALDEGEHDVLAVQPGQELVGRRGGEGVDGGLLLEDLGVAQSVADVLHPVGEELGVALGGERDPAELHAHREAGDPDRAEDEGGADGRLTVPGHHVRQPYHRPRAQREHGDEQDDHPGHREHLAGAAERLLSQSVALPSMIQSKTRSNGLARVW